MQLTSENYHSQEANKEYMSVSGYKDFAGTYGKMPCEFYGMEKLNGRWEDEKSTALLVGSYVDSYFEGSLEQFKKENPEIFTQKGELKANFKQAEEIIARIERDEYFMKFMSGQKQVIMTGELFGAKWKIKMDSYIPDVAIVDLKVMASITDLKWVKDIGYLDFVRYWGYDIQGAIYQEIVRQNTGKKLPFYIAGATKQAEPDIRIIHDMGSGLVIAKVPLDKVKEQDINARIMKNEMQDQLTANIKKRGQLESLPLFVLVDGKLEIISGHHRVKSARAAEMKEIIAIVDVSGLSRSKIAAKQLAHNAISGFDDDSTLREIVKMMLHTAKRWRTISICQTSSSICWTMQQKKAKSSALCRPGKVRHPLFREEAIRRCMYSGQITRRCSVRA